MDIFKVSTFTLSLWISSIRVELTVKGKPLCDGDCCENCSMWMWIKLCCDESLLASSQQTWQGRGLHHWAGLSSFWPGPGTQCTQHQPGTVELVELLTQPACCSLAAGNWAVSCVCRKAAKCCKYSELCNKQHRPVTREYTASPGQQGGSNYALCTLRSCGPNGCAWMFYCILKWFSTQCVLSK